MTRSESRTKVGAILAALVASAVVLVVAASPAVAQDGQSKTILFTESTLSVVPEDGTLDVQSAHGTLALSSEIAPAPHRAWLLSDLEVDGQVVRGQIFIEQVTLDFDPARQRAQTFVHEAAHIRGVSLGGEAGEPCSSGPKGSPAMASFTYDDGDGRVVTLDPVAVRIACRTHDANSDGQVDFADFRMWKPAPLD